MVKLPLIHHQLQLLLLHQDYPHHHLFFAAAEMKVVTPYIWFPHQCLLNSWYHSELSQQSWLNTWSSMFSSIQNRSFKNLLHSTETKINSSQMDHKHVTVSYFFPTPFLFLFLSLCQIAFPSLFLSLLIHLFSFYLNCLLY